MTADASLTVAHEAGSLESNFRDAGSPGKLPKAPKKLFHGLLSKLSRPSSRSGDSRGSSRPCSFDAGDRGESADSPAPTGANESTGMASYGKMHEDVPRRRGYSLDVRTVDSTRSSSGRSSRLFQALAGFSGLKPVNRLSEMSSEPCSSSQADKDGRGVADRCGQGEVAVISVAISAPALRGCNSEAVPECRKLVPHDTGAFATGAAAILDSTSEGEVASAPVNVITTSCDVHVPAALDTASAASWHASVPSARLQPVLAAPLTSSALANAVASVGATVGDVVAAADAAQAQAAAATVAAAAAVLAQRAPGDTSKQVPTPHGCLPPALHSSPETFRASAAAAAAAGACSSVGGPSMDAAAASAASPAIAHPLPTAFMAHGSAAAAAAAVSAAASPAAPQASAAPSAAPPPVPATRLLAVNPGVPEAMRRPVWCLEDYDVHRRLFKSATSSVYAGTCLHSGLPVALKVYWLDKVPANVLHMLRREIRIQSNIVHKNVVMLYAAFSEPAAQRLVLVEEFAANGDLHAVHKALGCRMNEQQARALVLRPLLEAVSHLHTLGCVHRDIKPDNIMFTSDWRLLLGDFGIAIDIARERAVTRAGTVGYMAPEVERCPIKDRPEDNKEDVSLAYSTAADVFGVGCLAYTLLLGFPPFIAGSKATPGRSKALSFPASTSAAAREFICSALAEEPGDRPTALQLLNSAWMTSPL